QQLEHFARAQPLARLKRGRRQRTGALNDGELGVHVPFIGEKRRAAFRQGERSAGPLDVREGGPQLTRGLVIEAPRMPCSPQSRVQPPGDLRCDVLTEPVEPRPVQRLGNDGEARSGVQICSLAERGRGADGIAQALEVGGRLGQQASGEGRVPTYGGELTERHARERGGALAESARRWARRSWSSAAWSSPAAASAPASSRRTASASASGPVRP